MEKPNFCSRCPINEYTEGYIPLQFGAGSELWVGDAAREDELRSGKPFTGGGGAWLNSLLRSTRIGRNGINFINTIGCRPFGNVYPGSDKWTYTDRATAQRAVQYCKQHHLVPALVQVRPSRIVALGEEALTSLTGRMGITLWRGSPLPLHGEMERRPRVVPTLHPANLMRQPGMLSFFS